MAGTTDRQHLGVVRKNATQEVRVSVGDYGGVPYIYALVCPCEEPPELERDRHPGLTVRAHTLRPLIRLLTEALELAEIREKAAWDDQEPELRRRWRR
jgi:hypothetical protein